MLQHMVPMPKEYLDDQTWYSWRLENWGTKWDIGEAHGDLDGDDPSFEPNPEWSYTFVKSYHDNIWQGRSLIRALDKLRTRPGASAVDDRAPTKKAPPPVLAKAKNVAALEPKERPKSAGAKPGASVRVKSKGPPEPMMPTAKRASSIAAMPMRPPPRRA